MNKQNLELLGLTEGATKEEITERYEQLRARYLEERFQDGEVGNNAARMLTRIEVAYKELMLEWKQSEQATGSDSAYEEVENFIRMGDYSEAQRKLDAFNTRNAHWHYLQSVVFYRKHWTNESKKQLEIAMQMDPKNEKYRESYRKMCEQMNANTQQQTQYGQQQGQPGGVYQGQTMNSDYDQQMGGNFCANCAECCACNMLLNLCCNSCLLGCN